MGAMIERRSKLVEMLADINSLIAKAESLTVIKGDDDTLQRASKVLTELREQRRDVEAKLRREE
jgi:hypothetical protein